MTMVSNTMLLMGIGTISNFDWAIFSSYVKLSEGIVSEHDSLNAILSLNKDINMGRCLFLTWGRPTPTGFQMFQYRMNWVGHTYVGHDIEE